MRVDSVDVDALMETSAIDDGDGAIGVDMRDRVGACGFLSKLGRPLQA